MARKFSRNAFINWLDALARICVFTRDDFTCQMKFAPDCYGSSFPTPQDRQCCHIIRRGLYNSRWDIDNLITGCSKCHAALHQDVRLGSWFEKEYPHRDEYLTWLKSLPVKSSWKPDDFREKEEYLLGKCVDLEVVPELMGNKQFARRLERILFV